MTKPLRRLIAVAAILAVTGAGAVYGATAMHGAGHGHARAEGSCWQQRLTPRRILLLRRGPLNDAAARRIICGGEAPQPEGQRR